ncbi:Uncharacterised protein [Klebsiella pneumoniae]|nr:Uncharacterised protein [Klebsiella pneumoniae]SLS93622.1 Uncharacterised protein [Klebsiella pneumoniae]SLT00366.1 Uncharacterised protein [Klebsiella pneumoniae]SLT01561.1 Uncharacterised protein [Klebsiella pneumoniae]SLT16051.1 Uncharacterised protein [Klebsiella pneumoniae]
MTILMFVLLTIALIMKSLCQTYLITGQLMKWLNVSTAWVMIFTESYGRTLQQRLMVTRHWLKLPGKR